MRRIIYKHPTKNNRHGRRIALHDLALRTRLYPVPRKFLGACDRAWRTRVDALCVRRCRRRLPGLLENPDERALHHPGQLLQICHTSKMMDCEPIAAKRLDVFVRYTANNSESPYCCGFLSRASIVSDSWRARMSIFAVYAALNSFSVTRASSECNLGLKFGL